MINSIGIEKKVFDKIKQPFLIHTNREQRMEENFLNLIKG